MHCILANLNLYKGASNQHYEKHIEQETSADLVGCQFVYSYYSGISFSPFNCPLGLSEKLILYSSVIKWSSLGLWSQ